MTPVTNTHINVDAEGRAWIDDTNVKVIEVAMDHVAYKWSPDAIHVQHPHLSLAQIHAALAYYFDHQQEFDAEIDRQEQEYQARWEAQGKETAVHQRLRAAGKIP